MVFQQAAHPWLFWTSLAVTGASCIALSVEDFRRLSVPLWMELVLLAACAGVAAGYGGDAHRFLISPLVSLAFFGLAYILSRRRLGLSDVLTATGLSVFIPWERLPLTWVMACGMALVFVLVRAGVGGRKATLRKKIPMQVFLVAGYGAGWVLCVGGKW